MNKFNSYNIDELAKFICMGKHSDLPCHEWCKERCEYRERAKAISDAGYHRTMWHKISDGDLPNFISDLIIAIKCNDGVIRTVTGTYRLERFNISDLGEIDAEKVIAWAELPSYEESLHEN